MQNSDLVSLFSGATAAATVAQAVNVSEWETVILNLMTSGSANFTLNIKASDSELAPDFSAASTPTNFWDYVDIIDLSTGTSIDGAVGMITTAGTDILKRYSINGSVSRWVSATITARVAGAITLKVRGRKTGNV